MKIDCYISLGCTSESALKNNISQALKLEDIDAEVQFHRIDDIEAESAGLKGSPSIFINGKDIIPSEIPGFS
jgi:hypothetical protein